MTEAIGDVVTSSNQYVNLARLYEKQGDIPAAAVWLEKALEIRRRIGHPDAEAVAAWLAELNRRRES